MAPPVIPVVPRSFESKKKTSPAKNLADTKTVANRADPGTQTPQAPKDSTTSPPEASDWASLAAEEASLDTYAPASDDSKEQGSAQTTQGNVAENGLYNGHFENSLPTEPEANGYRQQPLQPAHQINGNNTVKPRRFAHAHAYPPGLAPFHHRGSSHIAFGSFGEPNGSENSSPTLPPSATSTHFTQPTPVSDTPSQGSRVGHSDGAAEHMISRPPFLQDHAKPSKIVDRRHDNPDALLHATSIFNDRNRDDLLRSVQQDLFVGGVNELDLLVSTNNGKDSFKIWRAICRRSPELSRLLDQVALDNVRPELYSRSTFVSLESVRYVIQSLYGCPLLAPELLAGHKVVHFRKPLEIIATGYLLGAGLVIDYGTQLAVKMTCWKSLTFNFQFCLEGTQLEYGNGKSEGLTNLPQIITLPRPHAVDLLAQNLDCIIREINGDDGFRFDDHAAYIVELGGGFHARPVSVSLPGHTPNPTPAVAHGPSQIQFGNMGNLYRHKHQTLSGILLSLPLVVLQHVLSHVYNIGIVEDVIREREKRRMFALKNGSTSYHARYEERLITTRELNRVRVISTKVL